MTVPTPITSPDGQRWVSFLDVSGWQFNYAGNGRLNPGAQPPNYELAAVRGVAGVIARIGNGTSLDESFALQHGPARAAGLAVGAYYYAQPNRLTGRQAADRCAGWLANYPLDLPWMLDFEEYHGPPLKSGQMAAWLTEWFDEAQRLTGRRPLLYAGASFANPKTVAGSFANYDTVQPRYPRDTTSAPSDLADLTDWLPWNRQPRSNRTLGPWNAWQYTSSHHWPDFGGPPDARTNRLDANLVPPDTWATWTNTSKEPDLMRIILQADAFWCLLDNDGLLHQLPTGNWPHDAAKPINNDELANALTTYHTARPWNRQLADIPQVWADRWNAAVQPQPAPPAPGAGPLRVELVGTAEPVTP